jgi:hypothetical protein
MLVRLAAANLPRGRGGKGLRSPVAEHRPMVVMLGSMTDPVVEIFRFPPSGR